MARNEDAEKMFVECFEIEGNTDFVFDEVAESR